MKPKFSIFTCSYNNPGNIAVAINSILRQTVPDFEYFIIDSSDDGLTRGIIKEFKDPRIIYIEENFRPEFRNKNYVDAYLKNKYFPKARGKYIAILSDNDIMMTNAFLENSLAFDRYQAAHAMHFGAEVMYTDNSGKSFQRVTHEIINVGNFKDTQMESGNVIFEASLLPKLGKPFDEKLSPVKSEFDFVKRLSEKTAIYPIGRCLMIERRTQKDDQD